MNSLAAILDVLLGAGPTALIAKITLLLAGALILSVLLRRRSPAARHLVWFATLVGCASLAVATPLAPRIPIAVGMTPRAAIDAATHGNGAIGRAIPLPSPSEPSLALAPSRIAAAVPPARTAWPTLPRLTSWIAGRAKLLAGLAWAIGAVVLFARAALARAAIHRMIDRARDFAVTHRDVAEAAAIVGLRRPPAVLGSDAITLPITAGFRRPVVLLPAASQSWTQEQRRIVLVHELAHVARRDYLAQLAATVTSALLWFHPLVWLAAARLRAEAEHAADDVVLATGTAGIEYASVLLSFAHAESRVPEAALAVGIVHSSRLEARFRAILDASRSRTTTVSGRLRMVIAVAGAMGMIPMAGVRAVVAMASEPAQSVLPSAQARAVATSGGATAIATAPPIPNGFAPSQRSSSSNVQVVDQSIAARPGERLRLDLDTGGSLVVHGQDDGRVRVHAELRGRDAGDVQLTLNPEDRGGRLHTFTGGLSGDLQLTIELWVPSRMDLDIASAGGSVEVDGVRGAFSGSTGGGTITIRDASGTISLRTGGGDVRVSDSNLSGTIWTGWGEADLTRVSGGLTIEGPSLRSGRSASSSSSSLPSRSSSTTHSRDGSFDRNASASSWTAACSGDAVVSLDLIATTAMGLPSSAKRQSSAPPSRGAVRVSQGGGRIDVDAAPDGGVLSTGGGDIFVGSSNRLLMAVTGGGDVDLGRVGGDAHVTTGSGAVRVSVINDDGTEHSVSVCDGHGTVTLDLPARLDATLSLETAYTESFGRKTRIDSDFTIERSETNEWDSGYGTPRKFVRATGVVGSGHGRILVQTVNGDIIVRRQTAR